jgi:hypothetical protein
LRPFRRAKVAGKWTTWSSAPGASQVAQKPALYCLPLAPLFPFTCTHPNLAGRPRQWPPILSGSLLFQTTTAYPDSPDALYGAPPRPRQWPPLPLSSPMYVSSTQIASPRSHPTPLFVAYKRSPRDVHCTHTTSSSPSPSLHHSSSQATPSPQTVAPGITHSQRTVPPMACSL